MRSRTHKSILIHKHKIQDNREKHKIQDNRNEHEVSQIVGDGVHTQSNHNLNPDTMS